MKSQIIQSLTNNFESFANTTDNGVEFWLARDLQLLLGYTQWRNFAAVIEKAKTACKLSKQAISDHFADVSKTIEISKEHIINNKTVRDTLISRGITPEKLPPEDDVKKVERKLLSEKKKSLKNNQRFDKTKI